MGAGITLSASEGGSTSATLTLSPPDVDLAGATPQLWHDPLTAGRVDAFTFHCAPNYTGGVQLWAEILNACAGQTVLSDVRHFRCQR